MTQFSDVWTLAELAALATAVNAGVLKLGKTNIGLGASVTKATLIAQEADFDGYAAITLPAPLDPYGDGVDTWSFQTATQQFNYVLPAPPAVPVTNRVYNAWIETAAGVLVQSFTLVEGGVLMDNNLSALPLDLKFTKTARAE